MQVKWECSVERCVWQLRVLEVLSHIKTEYPWQVFWQVSMTMQ